MNAAGQNQGLGITALHLGYLGARYRVVRCDYRKTHNLRRESRHGLPESFVVLALGVLVKDRNLVAIFLQNRADEPDSERILPESCLG